MTRTALKTLPVGVLTVLAIGVLMAHVDVAYRLRGGLPFGASNLLLAALVCLTGGTLLRSLLSPRLRARIVATYVAQMPVILPFLGVILFSLLSAFLPSANFLEGTHWVLLPVYDLVVVLLAMLLAIDRLRQRYLQAGLLLAFLLLLGSLAVDVMRPGTFSRIEFRASGFPSNPNGAAFVLVALASAIVDFNRIRFLDLIVLALAALGVVATLSRGGTVLLVLLVLSYSYFAFRRSRGGALRAGGRLVMICAVATVGCFAIDRLMGMAMFSLQSDRLEIFRGRSEALTSEDSRFAALRASWRFVQEAPLLGRGSGFTYDGATLREGPHNMYVQQWLNNGFGGLICYVWLFLAAARLFWRRRHAPGLVFTGLMAVQGLLSHNLLEERAFLLPFGIFLMTSYLAATESQQMVRRRSVMAPTPLTPQSQDAA
jgi:O-antigen ligase